MRTTVNLDDDLLREAKKRAALSDRSLSAFVADAVREALARRAPSRESEPVHLVTVRGKLLPGINYDSFAELNDRAEGLE
jgi:Arc/MetJ family transcription regulator